MIFSQIKYILNYFLIKILPNKDNFKKIVKYIMQGIILEHLNYPINYFQVFQEREKRRALCITYKTISTIEYNYCSETAEIVRF